MKFNRFETIGMTASVLCLVAALWLLREETTTKSVMQRVDTQAAAVYVTGSDEASLREAFSQAGGQDGLTRLVINDVVIGAGKKVEAGDIVEVHYTGMLENGQEFDNSYNRDETISFEVGAGRVIAGWDEGVVGMQVGGKRILVIPSDLAYGTNGYGPIPGNATLVFVVELVAIN